MENLRTSKLLKLISYILIPILVLLIALSILHFAFLNEYGTANETQYSKTEIFADDYLLFIIDKVKDCMSESSIINNFMEIEGTNGQKYYYSDNESYIYNNYDGIGTYIDYIIINKQTNEMYTNMRSNNYEQEIEDIKNYENHWIYANGIIDTDIEYINNDNIIYKSIYRYFETNEDVIEEEPIDNTSVSQFDIYSKYNPNRTGQLTNFQIAKDIYEFALNNQKLPIYILPISTFMLLIIIIYLLWSIGHEKESENDEIKLTAIDNIPYEILTIIGLSILIIFIAMALEAIRLANYISIIVGIVFYVLCYIICAGIVVSTIKRIKAKRFFKSFLTYSILKWIKNKLQWVKKLIGEKIENKKIFWYYWGFVLISIILASIFFTGVGVFVLIGFWIWVYYKIKQYIKNQEQIKNALSDIYNGKKEVYIDDSELNGTLKEMAIYVNDISGGFSNAIEESLKSERLKTELITNVSHDIKTPLTSIINYVDLLKKEEIQNEKAKEYIDILDNKSQRLKKLTEDLIEASKVSSGNVKLNIENINIKELINQTIGEFKDRFEEKGLKIETQISDENLIIKADNRYVYRIIENLFSNITKYAQENSRVYIDIERNRNYRVHICLKNISKEKLNINADELMQRFVRGDKSRYTEGSGLGLSIAKSLTELQKGKFSIKIDGDLFRVDIEW